MGTLFFTLCIFSSISPPITIVMPSLTVTLVSASDVRRRVARGASVRYLVPDAVIDYIEKHRLYEEED